MRYVCDALVQYITAKLNELALVQEDSEYLYLYTKYFQNRIYSNFIPADRKSYIEIAQVGEIRKRYTTITYNVAVRIDKKGTANIPYSNFYYLCKGIRDEFIKSAGTYIKKDSADEIPAFAELDDEYDNMFVVNVIDLSGVTPYRGNNNEYFCEVMLQFVIDIATIPDEDIILNLS